MLGALSTWTKRGQGVQFEVPTRWGKAGRINIIGTWSLHGQETRLEYRLLEGACRRAQVVADLDTLAQQCDPKRLTVVVLDNAAFHKGGEIAEKRPAWEAQGLYLRSLPPYCPQLNDVEAVWRKLKGDLMPRRCYDVLEQLKNALLGALASLHAFQL